MALRPCTLDAIGKVVTPSFTEPVSRIFVFEPWEDLPGFASVYIGRSNRPFLLATTPITNFTNTRYPRREPYRLTLPDDSEWQIYKGGCGCGSPIRRLNIRMALDDYESLTSSSSSQPVGG